jgi:hypothetical protein
LLRNGGTSSGTSAIPILIGSYLDLVPIESMVLVETSVFRSNDGVLQIR